MAWLHITPSNDLDEWSLQLAQAKWIEERHYKTMARVTHGNKAVGG